MRILSVNVSKPKVILHKGKRVSTGIYKTRVDGPVMVRKTNIDGDAQADLKNHGGIDQAVYAFPCEHYAYYQERLGQDGFKTGHFGENLTTEGMLESVVHIGDQFRIGQVVLEVSQPRSPCFKFAMRMGTPDAVKQMLDSSKTGYYLRVVEEGMIETGQVSRSFSNELAPTVEEVHRLMYFDILNISELKKASGSSALGQIWRDEFVARLKKLSIKVE